MCQYLQLSSRKFVAHNHFSSSDLWRTCASTNGLLPTICYEVKVFGIITSLLDVFYLCPLSPFALFISSQICYLLYALFHFVLLRLGKGQGFSFQIKSVYNL
jgi:hypothetical protein